MLETQFKRYIQQILDIESEHLHSENPNILHSKEWEFIFEDFDGWVTLFAFSTQRGGFWISPRLRPNVDIEKFKEGLPNFSIHQPSVGFEHTVSGGNKHSIVPEWGEWKNFEKSEINMLFQREYYGRPKGQVSYFELNQIISHGLDLHWSSNKHSYCVVNELGEEVEKIK